MQRYFVPEAEWKNNLIQIKGDDAYHISRVMRFEIGNKIICSNNNEQSAICKITSISQSLIEVEVDEWLDEKVELPVQITVAQGLPKGDKFDFVLQKGTELGAYAFIPFQTERSIVKWDCKKAEKKLVRFSKIVKEASEQSHRNRIPIIKPVMSISDLIKESKHYDFKIFAYEEETRKASKSVFGKIVQKLQSEQKLLVCIGPEGGFAPNEAKLLKENSFIPVRLGPRILRTETAALYILASISYHFEELGCS